MIERNHEYYVSLEVAKLLKQAGFNWEGRSYYHCYTEELCFGKMMYDGDYHAPTLDGAQRWLREVKDIELIVATDIDWRGGLLDDEGCYNVGEKPVEYYSVIYPHYADKNKYGYEESDFFKTYEEALEVGIKKTLEITLEKGE